MEMEQAEQLYRLMFTNMREALVILHLDVRNPDAPPQIIEMNPAAVKLCRCSSFNFQSCLVTDCFPYWFDEDRFKEQCHRLAAFGGSQELGEVAREDLFYRIRIFALTDNHIGMVISDCTRYREEEAEIADLSAKLEKEAATMERRVAERTAQLEEINEELDSFAFSVSHDLRAPIRAMQAFAEILLDDEQQTPAERNAYLVRIKTAAQGMDQLIQDLLAYSRVSRQEITLEPVSLEQVVRDAAQQLELAAGGKAYRLEISSDLPTVIGHPAVLVQVVLNLMTNGIKFVPKGVVPLLRIWTDESQEYCRLYVEDNGIGIAPQHQERIFKIFERLHSMESYPGTGVGLAIVRKAVQRLGGRIGLESNEGEGSRFWIELRRAE
ncbi:two-component sensor histidine kinase [Geomonas sp. Red69]|uniref:histidine kinase n=1 Tax=Geomonas diazotrophica TaxID=2843197 RepID=A0ABX8JNQ3_9BACT|nr:MULTISPECIES: ATP-binding protein [Geomonas]MBU5637537.1 two-component sensor histidine kinase [Geomonas diazotrophica]QWV99343.1 two-component sensor histidine kinase [Geomonas nitrogeniifigens]